MTEKREGARPPLGAPPFAHVFEPKREAARFGSKTWANGGAQHIDRESLLASQSWLRRHKAGGGPAHVHE